MLGPTKGVFEEYKSLVTSMMADSPKEVASKKNLSILAKYPHTILFNANVGLCEFPYQV